MKRSLSALGSLLCFLIQFVNTIIRNLAPSKNTLKQKKNIIGRPLNIAEQNPLIVYPNYTELFVYLECAIFWKIRAFCRAGGIFFENMAWYQSDLVCIEISFLFKFLWMWKHADKQSWFFFHHSKDLVILARKTTMLKD